MSAREFLDALNQLDINCTESTFYNIFGYDTGKHLWNTKYVPMGNNMIRMYSYLDDENRQRLAEAVAGVCHLQSFWDIKDTIVK